MFDAVIVLFLDVLLGLGSSISISVPSLANEASGNTHKHAHFPPRVFVDFKHEVLRADVRNSPDLAVSAKGRGKVQWAI